MQNPTLYYTNARFAGKTDLLAGPFYSAEEAEHYIDVCGPWFVRDCPDGVQASYGVMSCNAFAGYGRYNLDLIAGGMSNVPMPNLTH